MALIKCPECKKKISDQCEKCPNCGYPLDKICEIDENKITDIENNAEETAKGKISFEINSLIKKWWFWAVVSAVIVAITVTTILLINRDTKPKFDKDGNPMFVELTNELYTNAEDYLGYHINIKGKVFQVMSDNGNVKGIQIWIDPDTCEQNMMIYYSTDVEVKQGDYVICSGYVDSVTEYKNAYGAKLYAPLVISSDLRKATYIEVMSPTIDTILPDSLKYEKYGYSVSIDKVEFAKKETRVYATAVNNGKATLNIGDAVIVQNGKQFNSTDNYDADYEEISYEIVKGASSSGIIVFPAITTNDFELTIDMHSDDYDEEIDDFSFTIGKTKTDILDFGYKTAVQTIVSFYNGELDEINKILPKEMWDAISKDNDATIDEMEEALEDWYVHFYDLRVKSFVINSEQRLSHSQLKDCLDGINYRYAFSGYKIQSITDGYELSVQITKPNGKKTTYKPLVIKIDGNWYWVDSEETKYPCFHTGPFTPAT